MTSQNQSVVVASLGCKLNQAEAEAWRRQLAAQGYEVVNDPAQGSVYVLNTCAVTQAADAKSRHLLRLAQRRNPRIRMVVAGCSAEHDPKTLGSLAGVCEVLGTKNKEDVVATIQWLLGRPRLAEKAGYAPPRTRSLVKVQDGCDYFCSYCIVPLVRGRPRSVPVDEVVGQVRERVVEGAQEVVLTGTQIGAYGRDGTGNGNQARLKTLIGRLLAETDVQRLRLTSLQPQDVDDGLVILWRDPRLCRHSHLPLQSGSDAVLARMGRRYTVDQFADVVAHLREVIPQVAITTDAIVGFPGESDQEFAETYAFCERMAFARIHVFPYSPRPGTRAAELPHQVSPQVKRQRSEAMLQLARESAHRYAASFLGQEVNVLWEETEGDGWSGLSDTYVRVKACSSALAKNVITPVTVTRVMGDTLWGVVR